MNKITFPITSRTQGSKVRDLQVALQLFLERGLIMAGDEAHRPEALAALQRESAEQTYGAATRKLVGIFQEERQLGGRGEVDEPTANAMNRLLDELSSQDGEQSEF